MKSRIIGDTPQEQATIEPGKLYVFQRGDKRKVVLATAVNIANPDLFNATCILDETGSDEVGYVSSTWVVEGFALFTGTIELKQ